MEKFSKTTRKLRDTYFSSELANRLRRCHGSVPVTIDAADPTGPRERHAYKCRHVLCPGCGPNEHKHLYLEWIEKSKTLHPDGHSLDVIHLVLTTPDWLWPLVLRKNPKPPAPKAEPAPDAASAPKKRSRKTTAERTTPGLEALKRAAWGYLADVYCDGKMHVAARELGAHINIHSLGDDEKDWPKLKPHADIVLHGYRLREGKLERLPLDFPARLRKDGWIEARRLWAKRLKRELKPLARTLDEHAQLDNLEWAVMNVARGSKPRSPLERHGRHRVEGNAYHAWRYSTRPMFTLAYAKLVDGPNGFQTMLRYKPEFTKNGKRPRSRTVPVEAAMRTIAGAVDLLQGAHVHTPWGIFSRSGYTAACKQLGREPVRRHKREGRRKLDRVIRKIGEHYIDPGPQIAIARDSEPGAA